MPAILSNKGSKWLAVSIILNSFRIFNSPKISWKYAKPYLLSLSPLLLMSISSLCKCTIPLFLNYQKKLESLCIRQEELNDVPFALFDVWIRFTFWFLCTIMQIRIAGTCYLIVFWNRAAHVKVCKRFPSDFQQSSSIILIIQLIIKKLPLKLSPSLFLRFHCKFHKSTHDIFVQRHKIIRNEESPNFPSNSKW